MADQADRKLAAEFIRAHGAQCSRLQLVQGLPRYESEGAVLFLLIGFIVVMCGMMAMLMTQTIGYSLPFIAAGLVVMAAAFIWQFLGGGRYDTQSSYIYGRTKGGDDVYWRIDPMDHNPHRVLQYLIYEAERPTRELAERLSLPD